MLEEKPTTMDLLRHCINTPMGHLNKSLGLSLTVKNFSFVNQRLTHVVTGDSTIEIKE